MIILREVTFSNKGKERHQRRTRLSRIKSNRGYGRSMVVGGLVPGALGVSLSKEAADKADAEGKEDYEIEQAAADTGMKSGAVTGGLLGTAAGIANGHAIGGARGAAIGGAIGAIGGAATGGLGGRWGAKKNVRERLRERELKDIRNFREREATYSEEENSNKTSLSKVKSHRGLGRSLLIGNGGFVGGYASKKAANRADAMGKSDYEIEQAAKKTGTRVGAAAGAALGVAGALMGKKTRNVKGVLSLGIGGSLASGVSGRLGAKKNVRTRLRDRARRDGNAVYTY